MKEYQQQMKNYMNVRVPVFCLTALLMMASSLAARADLLANNFWVNPFFEIGSTSTKLTAPS